MSQPIGWYQPGTEDPAGSGFYLTGPATAPASDNSGESGAQVSGYPTYTLRGGVVGAPSGAVVWDWTWTPEGYYGSGGITPDVYVNGNEIRIRQNMVNPSGSVGTMVVTATIGGVPSPTELHVTFADTRPSVPGIWPYGRFWWSVEPSGDVVTPEFWTEFINSREEV